MKKIYKSLSKNLLMVASVFVFIFINTTMVQAAELQPLKNTIEVNGKATIKVKPNIAYINSNVRTENKDAKIAQEENAKITEQIKKDMKSKYNLIDADINTSYYNVSPSYDYTDGKQIFRAYVVEHALVITVKDIEKAGEMSDTLIASGATSINNIKFDIIDSNATYNLALQKAIENAKSKSNAITTLLGVKEAKPIAIVEQSGSVGIVEREMSSAQQDSAVGLKTTSIEQSEIEIIARVAVTFQW